MKAWRKHNQKITANIRELQNAVNWYTCWGENPDSEEAAKCNKKITAKKKEYLRTKTERRGQFQMTATFPSNLLLAMFRKAGLPTPQIMP